MAKTPEPAPPFSSHRRCCGPCLAMQILTRSQVSGSGLGMRNGGRVTLSLRGITRPCQLPLSSLCPSV